MHSVVMDIIGFVVGFALVVSMAFISYIGGRGSFFKERVEKLRIRQKRRLLKRKK